MAKKVEFRDQVTGFLQTALHELHQASMYAQGTDNAEIRRVITTIEAMKERITREYAEDVHQQKADARRAAAAMKSRQEAALANRAKARKK
jgi:hypothetical protein